MKTKHEHLMQAYERKPTTAKEKADDMEIRVQFLLRNGLKSKSGFTLASTDVLKEIAKRLGYSKAELLKD